MPQETARRIFSDIYVDAHLKDFPNGTEYSGSLSPEETKSVKKAQARFAKAIRERKIEVNPKHSYHVISARLDYKRAIEDIARWIGGEK